MSNSNIIERHTWLAEKHRNTKWDDTIRGELSRYNNAYMIVSLKSNEHVCELTLSNTPAKALWEALKFETYENIYIDNSK